MKFYQAARYKKWTKWFAWRPVRTQQDELIWLETILRRRWSKPFLSRMPEWMEYKRLNCREPDNNHGPIPLPKEFENLTGSDNNE